MAKYPVEIRYEMEFAKSPARGLKERVVVSETVDLEIPEVASARTLVRGKVNAGRRSSEFDFECIESGGATWVRRDPPDEDESDLSRVLHRHAHTKPYAVEIPYKLVRNGVRPRASLVGRATIVEDGRDDAISRHERVAREFLLVDGRLFHRAPRPEWYVGRMQNLVSESNQVYLCTPFNNYGFVPCGRFPYDRLDEAVAFSRTLHDSLRGRPEWLPGDTTFCGSTLEISEPASYPSPGMVASNVWRQMAGHFERLEIHKLGFELLSAYHAAETASRALDVNPDDDGVLATLEGIMRKLAEWEVEGKNVVPLTLARVREIADTHALYRRMTEQLDPEDVAALAP